MPSDVIHPVRLQRPLRSIWLARSGMLLQTWVLSAWVLSAWVVCAGAWLAAACLPAASQTANDAAVRSGFSESPPLASGSFTQSLLSPQVLLSSQTVSSQAASASTSSSDAVLAPSSGGAIRPIKSTSKPKKPEPKASVAKSPEPEPPAAAPAQDKMIVEADELVYDDKANTVTASGNARIYYQGKILEADKVIYNRTTKRLFAEGHAKLTEKDGTVNHADKFDVTDDFSDGFAESLRTDTTDRTHLSSPYSEHISGDTTVFDKGTYTACDSCKNDASKPPLWRVRAKRIIHNNEEHMIYYQDAWLEFYGIPLAWIPWLSSPDPTVKRKSGLLSPYVGYRSNAGFGFGVPIFWDLADSYDVTLTPIYYSTQGFFGNLQWRQRLQQGSYFVKLNGIDEQDPSVFGKEPYASGDQKYRGSVESRGEFTLSDKESPDQWKVGWAGMLLSDKRFLTDYGVQSLETTNSFLSETTSTVYLTGQGQRGYFDLRGYAFEGLNPQDIQSQQAAAHPILDYNKSFDIDPQKPIFGWPSPGGQVTLDANFTSLSSGLASYQAVGTRTLDSAYTLYNTCTNYVPGTVTGTCLLRSIGGDFNRGTVDLSWKRKYIDSAGEVWTPFAFVRANAEAVDLNTTTNDWIINASNQNAASLISNASQSNFAGVSNALYGNAIPATGIDYRYPFLTKLPFASAVFEPIAQVIARPNSELGATSMVNMDSQSLVFDDSTLFQWDKNSGYDRFETGTRANYGGQITTNFSTGGYANLIGGQSYQLAGTNSYATPDAANIGLSSGLDTRRSDYVSSFTLAPISAFAFTAKGRFDVDTLAPRRIDLGLTTNFGPLTGGVHFADYQAQPVLGYYVRREGLAFDAKYKITDQYFAQGNVTFDMSRQYYPVTVIGTANPGPFALANMGLAGGYQDECCTFLMKYQYNYYDNGYSLAHNNTFLLELQLRTLGDVKFSEVFNSVGGLDGLK